MEQGFQVQLGAANWDAVAYCRALTEDTDPDPANQLIPDTSYAIYAEEAIEDFSRWVPLDRVVGDVIALTSPIVTVANVQRYVCTSANGFTYEPDRLQDILYRATNAWSAASESSYLAILPFSPINRFLFTPSLLDAPSERILRGEYLAEMDHYGKGWAGIVRDGATGLLAFDLYPIPNSSGLPIYVRYQHSHQATAVPNDAFQSVRYSSIPSIHKRRVARLLLATILTQEADRVCKNTSAIAGLLKVGTTPRELRALAERMREDTYNELGAAVPVAQVST